MFYGSNLWLIYTQNTTVYFYSNGNSLQSTVSPIHYYSSCMYYSHICLTDN